MTAATVLEVLNGERAPHELPPAAHDLWRDGFHAGAAAVRARLARAEADADYWYFEANNPDEARARRAELASGLSIDAAGARQETAERWAALDAAGRKAS